MIMSVLMEKRIIAVAEQMIKRGARIPVVAAMTPLKKDKITQLYKEIVQDDPMTGPLPSEHIWYTRTTYPMRVVQSSLLYNFYQDVKARNPDALEAEVLVAAYDLYIDHCKNAIGAEPLLTFVRAWHLMQQIRIKNLTTARCTCCEGNYIVASGKLYSKYKCQLCDRTHSLRPGNYVRQEELLAA
jgi:flagellar transcriptional activator FlhC